MVETGFVSEHNHTIYFKRPNEARKIFITDAQSIATNWLECDPSDDF